MRCASDMTTELFYFRSNQCVCVHGLWHQLCQGCVLCSPSDKIHTISILFGWGASGGHLTIILDEGEERLVIEVQNHTITYDMSYPFYEDIIKKT